MKYFIAVLCLAQVVLSAPSEPTLVDQTAAALASAKDSATAAVTELNQKVLEAAGVKSNTELLTTVQQQSESYAAKIKDTANEILEQVAARKPDVDGLISSIAKQISDTASTLIASQDPEKVDQLKSTFNSVLEQTNSLNAKIQEQGATAQKTFAETLEKLYENTLNAAKQIATQLDEQTKKQ